MEWVQEKDLPAMIELTHVSKTYGRSFQALFDITFTVEKGKFVYLMGPSGAGKTTLLKLLCAAERPTEGEIRVNGLKISDVKAGKIPYFRRRLGVVFQDLKLLMRRTAFENVAFALEVLRAHKVDVINKTSQALRLVGLERKANYLPGQLSAGEQQRVAIARAIVNDPVLLLADEPTGNIDMDSAEELIRLFDGINLRGTTIILATHDKVLPEMLPKERIVLDRGRILGNSEPTDPALV